MVGYRCDTGGLPSQHRRRNGNFIEVQPIDADRLNQPVSALTDYRSARCPPAHQSVDISASASSLSTGETIDGPESSEPARPAGRLAAEDSPTTDGERGRQACTNRRLFYTRR